MDFGEKLSAARKAKGFSQEELAAKIEVSRVGKVRRAKLYFLRALRGRSARIADDLSVSVKDVNAGVSTKK